MSSEEEVKTNLDIEYLRKFWRDDLEVPQPIREIFEKYSNVPADQVIPHIQDIRTKAWQVLPYPCIGQSRFLNLNLSRLPQYPDVLAILRQEPADSEPAPMLLDFGCCLGQDIRKLVFDGIASSQIAGLDINPTFFALGYDLFKDRDSLKTRLCIADILDPSVDEQLATAIASNSPPLDLTSGEHTGENLKLGELAGRFSVIVMNSIFHLFSYKQQVTVALRVLKLLRPGRGTIICGSQVGSKTAKELPSAQNKTRFVHDTESWTRFWMEDVASAVGEDYRFDVDVGMRDADLNKDQDQIQLGRDPDMTRLRFAVRLV